MRKTKTYEELCNESKIKALENIDKILRKEVGGGFVSVYREILEKRAKGYKFSENGTILKEGK